jgi:hypothetical protein
MRNDGNVVGTRMRADLEQLGQTTEPHHVGLKDVDGAILDELAEAVTTVFVLSRRPFNCRKSLFEEFVAIEIVGVEDL